MYRKNCGCNQPCNCDMSVTTSSCGVSCPPPVMACPPVVCQPGVTPTPPKITIEDLLKLIETKCDKETCKVLQFEIDYLYWMLDQNKPGGPSTGGPDIPKCPDGTYECHPPCKDGTWDCYPHNPPHFPDTKLFQLVENMVEKLSGDLTGKYPSAALFKKELLALWKCMANKQQHHGDWKDNWTYRNIQQLPDGYNCLLDGGKDPAPGKIKVITPVDVGSTVFHEITNDKNVTKRCLFESLVDNNIVEPSMASVLDGKWINYCDIKEVIDCVLPRVKITDCKQACDDPNGDGVVEHKTLCERVTEIEDCCNKEDHVVDFKFNPTDHKYEITMKSGTKFEAAPDAADDFIENQSGVPITYVDDPLALVRIKEANYHFTGTYPADGKITAKWAISSGLAPVDPSDDTATKWFCVASMNHDPVMNAMAMISGMMHGDETGLFERPTAFISNHSKCTLEFVILRNFTNDVNQKEPLGNPVSPYADVDAYVKDKVSQIKANGWDQDTGTKIVALPKNWDWQSNISSQPIKSTYFDANPWISRYNVPIAMLYCRFKNESAISVPGPGVPVAPGYTPGKMTPQPIAQFNDEAYMQYMGGIFKYLKVLEKKIP